MTSFRRCTRKPRRLATWQTSAAFDPALSSEKADRSVAAYSAIDARLDPPQRRHHMTGSFFCRNVLPDAKNPPPAGEQSRGDPLVTLDIAVEFRRDVYKRQALGRSMCFGIGTPHAGARTAPRPGRDTSLPRE